MSPGGRRSGNVDTRAHIVAAARAAFAADGYNGATLRGIARQAGVDPALIHHYFADKARLFIEAMHLPGDPRAVQQRATHSAGRVSGARLVEAFLAQWEPDGEAASDAYLMLAQAVTASKEVARAVREFLDERLGEHLPPDDDPERRDRRRTLVSSVLTGLAWNRYVMRFEPVASIPRTEVARWAGPVIDHLLFGPVDTGGPASGHDDDSAAH